MAGATAASWERLKSERFDPFILWRVVGEDRQLLFHLVHIFVREYPGMLREVENALNARDGAALRKASHKLKGTLLQFAAPAAGSAAAELEHCAEGGLENAPAVVETVKKETDFLIQMLQAMVSEKTPDLRTDRKV